MWNCLLGTKELESVSAGYRGERNHGGGQKIAKEIGQFFTGRHLISDDGGEDAQIRLRACILPSPARKRWN